MLHIFLFSACLTAAIVLFLLAAARQCAAPALLGLMLLTVAAFCS